jgi:hypothetical protein
VPISEISEYQQMRSHTLKEIADHGAAASVQNLAIATGGTSDGYLLWTLPA